MIRVTQLTCSLECSHQIEWGDESERPGADWPYVGRMAHCPECKSNREIVSVDPEQLDVLTETLLGSAPFLMDAGLYGIVWQAGDEVTLFYDTRTGTYGYRLHGVGDTGDYYESDDIAGFTSAQEALEAARIDYAESPREDYSEYYNEDG